VRQWPVFSWYNREVGGLLAPATMASGFCFSLGRYLRLLVLASFLLTSPGPPSTFSLSLHLVLLQLGDLMLIMPGSSTKYSTSI